MTETANCIRYTAIDGITFEKQHCLVLVIVEIVLSANYTCKAMFVLIKNFMGKHA